MQVRALLKFSPRSQSLPDSYTHQGTFRDIADPSNIPYSFQMVVASDSQVAKVEFVFVPTCEDEVPGCSGAMQSEEFMY